MKTKLLYFYLIALGMAFTLKSFSQLNAAPAKLKRPNILFILSDDHSYQAMQMYRSGLAKLNPTPN